MGRAGDARGRTGVGWTSGERSCIRPARSSSAGADFAHPGGSAELGLRGLHQEHTNNQHIPAFTSNGVAGGGRGRHQLGAE